MNKTPICDFVNNYAKSGAVRAHMPAHKGAAFLGCEALDITEISGADELYGASGIIKKSERIASEIFGTGETFYSTEGSSLCIRAMLFLALMNAKERGSAGRTVLAGRNAHKTLISAAALLDLDIEWLYQSENAESGANESLLRCIIDEKTLETALSRATEKPIAVYITSPDYLGNIADIAALSKVCRVHGVPLLVDNAHGAYLRFLKPNLHPIALGADICCDSAHKTLPCLTGAAYLHINAEAPKLFSEMAEKALSLFASTSPSYLILQSLDAFNGIYGEAYEKRLELAAQRIEKLGKKLESFGYVRIGNERLKLTLAPKSIGYTGHELAAYLRENGVECEFADPDFTVLMLSAQTGEAGLEQIEKAMLSIEKRAPIAQKSPRLARLERALSAREAVLAPQEQVALENASGRILALDHCACPPAVPIAIAGERLDETAIECLKYYGVSAVSVVKEEFCRLGE